MASLFGFPLTMNFLELLKLIFMLVLPLLAYRIKMGAKATFLEELRVLEAERDEFEAQVEREELHRNKRRSATVRLWMEDVDHFVRNQVHAFRNSPVFGVPLLCDARCWLADLVNHVRQLKARRSGITTPLVGTTPLALPVEDPRKRIVGGQETLEDIRRHLGNDDVGIVGVHGMAGIGKTTYLQVIAHEEWEKLDQKQNEGAGHDATGRERRTNGSVVGFCRTICSKAISFTSKLCKGASSSASQHHSREADDRRQADEGQVNIGAVIWVDVSDQQNPVPNIQKKIAKQLGVDDASEVSAACVRRMLEKKLFILFLDGVQQDCLIKWEDIGIPIPQPAAGRKSKIVFTACSWETCKALQAQELVKVNLLNEGDAWTLFQNTVLNQNLGDTSITEVAKSLSAKCGGLPHALKTVASAMSRCSTMVQWEEALAWWNEPSTTRIPPGMNAVFRDFQKSFEKLKTYLTQLESWEGCLLYCYLFPEDQAIHAERLVNYWIGEGCLDFSNYEWTTVRKKGYDVIRKLVRDSSLVSTGADDEKEVLLHDVVRRTTMWMIAGGDENKANIYLTPAELKLSRGGGHFISWRDAERVSYIGSKAKVSPGDHGEMMPECHKLLTLLLNEDGNTSRNRQADHLSEAPDNLFLCISTLRVLDLSGVDLDPFPPGIDSVVELSYLDLSYTNIRELPGDLEKLKKLRQLNLRGTSNLSRISHKSISKNGLQSLDLFGSAVNIDDDELRCLEGFKDLSELGLSLRSRSSYLEEFILKFSTSIVFLQLYKVPGLGPPHLRYVFDIMINLRELSVETERPVEFGIDGDDQLPNLEIFSLANVVITGPQVANVALLKSLRRLHITYGHLRELSWVHHLPECVMISPMGPEALPPIRLDRFKTFLRSQSSTGGSAATSSGAFSEEVILDID